MWNREDDTFFSVQANLIIWLNCKRLQTRRPFANEQSSASMTRSVLLSYEKSPIRGVKKKAQCVPVDDRTANAIIMGK